MRNRLRGRLAAIVVFLMAMAGLCVLTAPAASAHPLGNFTVNYYSGIRVEPNAVLLELVVDRAEIPTLQAFPSATIGQQPAGADAWKARECTTLAEQAKLTVAGASEDLTVVSSQLKMLPGAAGLATSRLECSVRTASALDTIDTAVAYQAAPTSGRVGWHEVTASGDGVSLVGSTVPVDSTSKKLTAYPQDLLASPLDQRTARFSVRAGSGQVSAEAASGQPSASPLYGLGRITTAYTDLISKTSLTPGFALLALVLSLALGSLHAFAPGHGKTLMAAYLVGREGTWRQAAVIGLSVTVTHTIGVLLLGVALSAAAIAAPEQVYPWLGLISGILLAGIGITLLRSAKGGHVHGPGGHTHDLGGHTHGPGGHTHGPGGHTHGPGGHTHGPGGHTVEQAVQSKTDQLLTAATHGPTLLTLPTAEHGHEHVSPVRKRHGMMSTGRLAAVGLVGGMVPSPSALLVLLGGIALGRAWFGAILVVAYGVGMAAALVGTGLLLVLARDRLERWSAERAERRELPGQALLLRWAGRLPILTATIVIIVGVWVSVRSIAVL